MTQQNVIKTFMASIAGHGYASSDTVGKDMLDSTIRTSSRRPSVNEAIAAVEADRFAAEKSTVT